MAHVITHVDEDVQLAARQAAGLRRLADMLAAHPELAMQIQWVIGKMYVSVGNREQVTAFARAGMGSADSVTKHANDYHAGVDLTFGPVGLHVYAGRDEVCERIVTGTREVTEEIPDPELLAKVPTVTRTRTVEDVEWSCAPFLSAGQS